ncbi:hypothetical protein Sste5346_009508 [Sporothrix stenoceras]|uniref:Heterokaryon incompatibility domain-containing protein n=1 Tax=Sporothrix stenoceras TaxID=5173 RepID=A0ABR3YKZ5_9PEZI
MDVVAETREEEVGVPAGTDLCDLCSKRFGEPSSHYKCDCHRSGAHFHLGRVDKYVDVTTNPPTRPKSTCPGCRLFNTIVTNMFAMIRRNDHSIQPAIVSTGVTSELKLLEDMVTSGADKTLKIEMRAAARAVTVKVDVLPGIAGTIIRLAGSPEKERIHGLRVREKQRVHGLHIPAKIDMDRTRRWLTTCQEGHASCRQREVTAPPQGQTPADVDSTSFIRLINVQTRQIVPGTLNSEFVALSYVWGQNTQPLLTRARLTGYMAPGGLATAELPMTISDAMEFVNDLGLRYLWVDSLCIIQDDDVDKQKQLPQMAALYEAAELVIVAAAGRDASAGLVGYKTDRQPSQAVETIDGLTYITYQSGLHDVLRWTHWDRRGWTYQEAFQARRAVVMADTLTYWSCRDTLWQEDLDNDEGSGVRLRKDSNALWRYTPDGQRTLGCTPNTYFTSVEHFCLRSLRDGSDALWAYWGVLAHQSPRFPPNGYIWGHPYGSISDSLLWRTGHFCLSEHRRRQLKTFHGIPIKDGSILKAPFPSWSWLSVDTAVDFLDTCGSSIVSAVKWGVPITLWNPASAELYLEYLRRVGVDGVDKVKELLVKQHGHLKPAPTPGQPFAMDYGLLCFTAKVAQLTLSRQYKHTNDDKCPCRLGPDRGKDKSHMYAAVRHGDKEIGGVVVPLSLFNGDDIQDVAVEVVHLSSNALPRTSTDDLCKVQPASGCREVQHVRGCQHIESHNLMVVAWEHGVAHRQALFALNKDAWEAISSEKKVTKRVILG